MCLIEIQDETSGPEVVQIKYDDNDDDVCDVFGLLTYKRRKRTFQQTTQALTI